MSNPTYKPPTFLTGATGTSIGTGESRKDFIARALQAGVAARQSNIYISADELLQRLDRSLARVRKKSRPD